MFRRCVATTALPTLAATAAALLLQRTEEGGAHESASGAASPHLTLPLLVAALGCGLTALITWPTFAQRRPGADAVRRAVRGPCQGRAAALLGAFACQLLLSLPLTTLLPGWLGAPAMARRHVNAQPTSPTPVLRERGGDATLHFDVPAGTVATAVWLRPIAAMPARVTARHDDRAVSGR